MREPAAVLEAEQSGGCGIVGGGDRRLGRKISRGRSVRVRMLTRVNDPAVGQVEVIVAVIEEMQRGNSAESEEPHREHGRSRKFLMLREEHAVPEQSTSTERKKIGQARAGLSPKLSGPSYTCVVGRRIFIQIASALALAGACATEEPLPYQEGESRPLPVLLFATEGLTFGALTQACSTAERKFCVENRSVTPLSINDLGVDHDEPEPDFSVTSIDGGLSVEDLKNRPLDPGARLCFVVTYAPKEPGVDAAELFVQLESFAEPLTLEIGGTSELSPSRTDIFELGGTTKIDFIFVLDNSPSMSDLRVATGNRLRRMFDQIEQFYDYRIAMLTADPNYRGQALPYDRPQIISRTLSNARELFSENLNVDEATTNDLHAFEAAFRFIIDNQFSRDAFLRPGAHLVLVWISDRDDMSDGPPEIYSEFFSRVPSDNSLVISIPFVRAGTEGFPCWASDPPAVIGTRFAQLSARLFGGSFSVCDDFTNALFTLPTSGPMPYVTLTSVAKADTLQVKLRLATGEETDPPPWFYDPATRTIQFHVQQPPIGSTLIATYDIDCE